MRRFRFTITAISLLLMGTLVACGDDDEASTTPQAEGSDGTGDTSDPAPIGEGGDSDGDESDGGDSNGGDAPTGGAGTVTADGETYGFNEIVNCEPPDADVGNIEQMLAVSALGDEGIAVHVRQQAVGDIEVRSLDWYGPDGVYDGSISQMPDGWRDATDATSPEPPLMITEDRISGTVTAVNTRATDETIELTVDIPYPSDITDC